MTPILARLWAGLIATGLSALLATPLLAQPLRVPWAPMPGIYDDTATSDDPGGFFADLARTVAQEAGLDLRFDRQARFQDIYDAMAQGRADLLAGIGESAAPHAGLMYSEPVAETSVYFFVRADTQAAPQGDALSGKRVAVVAQTAGSDLAALASAGALVTYPSFATAFGALLFGEVDGVVSLHKGAIDALSLARIEHRVRIEGPSLATIGHYVAVTPDHADLLPRINAAIDRLRGSGQLEKLLVRWNMVRAAPVPDVLVVGVGDFPPYHFIDDTGTATGYGVDALRDLARLARLELTFRAVSTKDWTLGPNLGNYDILPPISINPERRARMAFTIPLQQSPYSAFARTGEAGALGALDTLIGRRVGVADYNAARQAAEAHGGLDLMPYDSAPALLDALLAGEVDAVLYASSPMHRLLEQEGATAKVDEALVPFLVSERAIPLRAGLGAVRERLDAIIPGYLSSDAHHALYARWFAPPEFWTSGRKTSALVAAVAVIMAVIGSFLWQSRSARRRAEGITETLRGVNDRLTAVLDTARSAIFGLTPDGQIAFANAGARRLLGLADGPVPQDWPKGAQFIDPDTLVPLTPAQSPLGDLAHPDAGEAQQSEILAFQRPDDAEPRFVTLSSAPLPDGDGIVSVIVMDDVTDQQRARQRAERSSRLDALGQLTGGVAHDFNNILATIDYAAQLALPHADDTGRRFLNTASQSVRRGADLTTRLLAFAKRQSGSPRSHPVAEVLSEFRDLAVPAIEERIELVFAPSPNGLHVHCDLPQLENALLNLVLNSRDALLSSGAGSGSGGRITVTVREVHDLIDPATASQDNPLPHQVEFAIADNGPGMTDDIRKRATDPFFTTKPEGAGSGLGLAMVYGFAENSGGAFSIYSVPGRGTTARLTLPAARPEGGVVSPEDRAPVAVGGHERILLVEDEPALLDLAAETLRALGFDVATARSGDLALEMLQTDTTVDLLLSDVVMPGRLDGIGLARAARQLYPTLPVVFMSGYTGAVRSEDLAELGVILQKPCAPSELARALRTQLDAAR